MKEFLYSMMIDEHPFIVENIADYYARGKYELIVIMKDGHKESFHEFDKILRRVPQDSRTMTEEQVNREFGRRLHYLMWEKGITQSMLSEMTGVSQASISGYIRGVRGPSFIIVDKFAKALGCSTDDFRYID